MRADKTMVKVTVFTVVMLLVAAALVVIFGEFRFAAGNTYHATFTTASRLQSGQDVRIAGVPVGSVKRLLCNRITPSTSPSTSTSVISSTPPRRHWSATRTWSATGIWRSPPPGELDKLAPGATLPVDNTRPALDLDALLGGLRPVLKGLDGNKVNEITGAVIELLQGNDGALSQMLASTSAFSQSLAARDELIGDVITNLNTVLTTVDAKSAEFDASVDQLQQLITSLAEGATRSPGRSARWPPRRPS